MERPWLCVVFKSESVAFPCCESFNRTEVDYTQLVLGLSSLDAAVGTTVWPARTSGVCRKRGKELWLKVPQAKLAGKCR